MDIAEKTLEPDDELQDIFKPYDEVQNIFNASHNDQKGFVLLSKKKFLFVSEKGFIRRIYDLDLEVPYDIVDDIRCIGNVLTFLVEGKRQVFKSGHASVMEQSIKNLKELKSIKREY